MDPDDIDNMTGDLVTIVIESYSPTEVDKGEIIRIQGYVEDENGTRLPSFERDSDSDSMPDGWEVYYDLEPLRPTLFYYWCIEYICWMGRNASSLDGSSIGS